MWKEKRMLNCIYYYYLHMYISDLHKSKLTNQRSWQTWKPARLPPTAPISNLTIEPARLGPREFRSTRTRPRVQERYLPIRMSSFNAELLSRTVGGVRGLLHWGPRRPPFVCFSKSSYRYFKSSSKSSGVDCSQLLLLQTSV